MIDFDGVNCKSGVIVFFTGKIEAMKASVVSSKIMVIYLRWYEAYFVLQIVPI